MTLIQLRRGTAAEWTVANPILRPGEPGVELDTGFEKIGNGTDHWSDLPYTKGDSSGASGLAIKRAWYRHAPEAVPTGVVTPLSWHFISGDTGMLDLTDPTMPVAAVSGLYAVTMNACCGSGSQTGEAVYVELDLDLNGIDATASATASLDNQAGGVPSPQASLSLMFYVPATTGIVAAWVEHGHGSDLDFFLEAAVVFIPASIA